MNDSALSHSPFLQWNCTHCGYPGLGSIDPSSLPLEMVPRTHRSGASPVTQSRNPSSVHLSSPLPKPCTMKQSRKGQKSVLHGAPISLHGWSQQGGSKIPSSSWAPDPAGQGQNCGYRMLPNPSGRGQKSQPFTDPLCHPTSRWGRLTGSTGGSHSTSHALEVGETIPLSQA